MRNTCEKFYNRRIAEYELKKKGKEKKGLNCISITQLLD